MQSWGMKPAYHHDGRLESVKNFQRLISDGGISAGCRDFPTQPLLPDEMCLDRLGYPGPAMPAWFLDAGNPPGLQRGERRYRKTCCLI
jgi:hypothetical protein